MSSSWGPFEILPQASQVKPFQVPAVYVLSCSDGSLYAGSTTNLPRRIGAHRRGVGAKYTRGRLPVCLVAWWHPATVSLARSHEARFKRLARTAKLVLLKTDEAFGCRLRKPPLTPNTLDSQEPDRMIQTAPQPDEMDALTEQARASQVRIETNKGDIVVTLFPDDAPVHAAAFLKLVKAGFYDGLAFHRVEPGFVVQGGDPDGDGTGGPGYRIKAEFNERPHERGTLAMARSSDPDSAGSQFYLCLADARFLDGQYTVFGTMTAGFKALDAIRRGDIMRKLTVEPLAQPASG
jgi:peptidylprolyl isomerase/peptidyl-prolyl cis-trans isomerase B (cyclophilin B)